MTPHVYLSLLQKAWKTIFPCLDHQGCCRIYIKSSTWHHIFIILATTLDAKKFCRNYVEAGKKWPKCSKWSSREKWIHLITENLNCDYISDNKNWMGDVQWDDISGHYRTFLNYYSLSILLLAKQRTKLCIHLPNAGHDHQSCPIITALFDQSDQLRVRKYNI